MTPTLPRLLPLALLLTAAAPAALAETAFPQKAELHYVGPYGVPAVMTFEQNNGQYRVVADINAPMYKMRFTSQGRISGNRLSPASYSDIRRGRLVAGPGRPDGRRTPDHWRGGRGGQPRRGPSRRSRRPA